MENTLSDIEHARVPDQSQHDQLAALSSGVIAAFQGQPVVADPNLIVTSVDWGDGALTVAAQPDVPRNLTAVLTDADGSITAGLLTATGIDPMGRVITETMDITDGLSWTGEKIFARVDSVVISGTAGTPAAGVDTVIVGIGNVIGTPVDLSAENQVIAAYIGGGLIVAASIDAIATGESKSGIDLNSQTYDGSKIMWALLKPNY
jgi:hypothetical protein